MTVAIKHFTDEQIAELAAIFGLEVKAPENILPVRDGVIRKGEMVWWRGDFGPQHVNSEADWINIRDYPARYSLAKPAIQSIVYRD